MIKGFKQFIENLVYHDKDDETKLMIDDMFLEYMDKYGLYNVSDTDLSNDQKKTKPGFYIISDKISTSYFKVDGFPKDSTGYQISLHFMNYESMDKNSLHSDMLDFIERVCKSLKFKYDTSVSRDTYRKITGLFISFYNEL